MPLSAPLIALAISQRAAFVPDPVVDAWFEASELVGPVDGVIGLTERGRVWVDRLLSTPLPVSVARWGYPDDLLPVRTLDAKTGVWKTDRGPIRATYEPVAIATPTVPDVIPPGFNPNRWADLSPGAVPPGMQRDTELEVVLRNGKTDKRGQYLKMFAAQVPWQRVDTYDAVIAYRVVPGEQLVVSGTALTQ